MKARRARAGAHVRTKSTHAQWAEFEAGDETSEVRLFSVAELPWDEISFPSVKIALQQLLKSQGDGDNGVHLARAPRIRMS